jgi:subtilisin family serine protease
MNAFVPSIGKSAATVAAGFLLLATTVAEERTPGRQPRRAAQQVLFDRLEVDAAWTISQGNPDVVIGVIDNGFDFFHPDLKERLVPGYYYPGGYHPETFENVAHGTMVAGIIVGKNIRSDDVTGLAPQCRVLAVSQGTIEHLLVKLHQKMREENPQATTADINREVQKHAADFQKFGETWARYQLEHLPAAIRYLVDGGVKVINISGALERTLSPFPEVWRNIDDAFGYAEQRNVLIVLAAGNTAAKWEDYPGSNETTLVVGATLLNDDRWETEVEAGGIKVKRGSCFGKRLSVMAPVERLIVCAPHEERFYPLHDGPLGPMRSTFGGSYRIVPNGATSSAAPIVSALAALIYSLRPDLDVKSVARIIQQGCDDLGEPGRDDYTGFGRVNFWKTLELAQRWKE